MNAARPLDKIPFCFPVVSDPIWRIVPFIVAPLDRLQYSVVLGSDYLCQESGAFVSAIYGQLEQADPGTMFCKTFRFQGDTGAAIVLPTRLRDEAGRGGLSIAFGCLSNARFLIPPYLRAMVSTINHVLKLDLPVRGADELLMMFRKAADDSTFTGRLGVMAINLILASDIVRSVYTAPAWWHKLRINARSLRFRPRKRVPRVVWYPRDGTADQIMGWLMTLAEDAVAEVDEADDMQGKLPAEDKAIRFRPIPEALDGVRGIQLRRDAQRVLWMLY